MASNERGGEAGICQVATDALNGIVVAFQGRINMRVVNKILHMIEENRDICDIASTIEGPFSFIIINSCNAKMTWAVVRDPIGLYPVYFGFNTKTSCVHISSHRRGVASFVEEVRVLQAGSYISCANKETPKKWYDTRKASSLMLNNMSNRIIPNAYEENNDIFHTTLRDELDGIARMCGRGAMYIYSDNSNASRLLLEYTKLMNYESVKIVYRSEDSTSTTPTKTNSNSKPTPKPLNLSFTLEQGIAVIADVMTTIEHVSDYALISEMVPFWLLFKLLSRLNIRNLMMPNINKTLVFSHTPVILDEIGSLQKLASIYSIQLHFPFLNLKMNEYFANSGGGAGDRVRLPSVIINEDDSELECMSNSGYLISESAWHIDLLSYIETQCKFKCNCKCKYYRDVHDTSLLSCECDNTVSSWLRQHHICNIKQIMHARCVGVV